MMSLALFIWGEVNTCWYLGPNTLAEEPKPRPYLYHSDSSQTRQPHTAHVSKENLFQKVNVLLCQTKKRAPYSWQGLFCQMNENRIKHTVQIPPYPWQLILRGMSSSGDDQFERFISLTSLWKLRLLLEGDCDPNESLLSRSAMSTMGSYS